MPVCYLVHTTFMWCCEKLQNGSSTLLKYSLFSSAIDTLMLPKLKKGNSVSLPKECHSV